MRGSKVCCPFSGELQFLTPSVGYDAIGAKELGNKLVGTSKFIGTAGNTMC